MNYNIKGSGIAITPELREYAEKKLGNAEKFVEGDTTAHADVELENSQARDGGKYRAEFTLSVGGTVYRAQKWGGTMHEAMDIAAGELVHELTRAKKKRLHMVRRGASKIKNLIRGLTDRF